jgi:hypothetical protein
MYVHVYIMNNIYFSLHMFSYIAVPFWVMGEFYFKLNIRYTFWQLSRNKVYTRIYFIATAQPLPPPPWI